MVKVKNARQFEGIGADRVLFYDEQIIAKYNEDLDLVALAAKIADLIKSDVKLNFNELQFRWVDGFRGNIGGLSFVSYYVAFDDELNDGDKSREIQSLVKDLLK